MTPTPMGANELSRMRGVLDIYGNCALKAVASPGAVDIWDRPTTTVTTIWSGVALAFIGRQFKFGRGVGLARSVTVEKTEAGEDDTKLIVLDGRATLAIQAAIDTGATLLTVEDRRIAPYTTLTFRASSVRHEMFGLLDYLEIDLRDPEP